MALRRRDVVEKRFWKKDRGSLVKESIDDLDKQNFDIVLVPTSVIESENESLKNIFEVVKARFDTLEQENRERDEKFKKEIEQSRKREEKLNNRIEQLQNENADLKQTVSDLEIELGVLEKKVDSFVAKMRAREVFIRLVSFCNIPNSSASF